MLAVACFACARIAFWIILFLFAEYKIVGSEFTPAGFEHWVRGWVEQGQVVGFYKPVLVNIALGHPVLCARLVAWGELGIAVSLILGLLVRPAAIGGMILMINFILSTWFGPGHGAPVWQYFGANLDHFRCYFVRDFYATRAGRCLGWTGVSADEGTSGIRHSSKFGTIFAFERDCDGTFF